MFADVYIAMLSRTVLNLTYFFVLCDGFHLLTGVSEGNVIPLFLLMLFKVDDSTPFDIQAETTLKTNFFATRNVCMELLPIMKPHGKPSVGLMSLRKQPQVPQTGLPT